MLLINSLTSAQKARFPEFVQKWTEIGLSTTPANRPKAEAAIREVYQYAGLRPPSKIVWCGSPFSQGMARAVVLSKNFQASVGDSVRASVQASVGDSIYGAHDAHWLSLYDYFAQVCGLQQETSKLQGLQLLAQNAGWALPHEHICWVSERHHVLNRDNQGRLHSLSGPAVAYPDGWAIYAVHGVRVPHYVIEEPQKITASDIKAESNTEIRRIKLSQFGEGRYLEELGAKPIAADKFGTLYRAELPEDEPLVMVKVWNSSVEPDGTIKPYYLRVPPEMTRSKQAVAWTFGLSEDDYGPQQES